MSVVSLSSGFRVYDVAGLFLIIFGSLVFTGLIPLSGVSNVTVSNVSAQFNPTTPNCPESGSATIANVAETSLPLSVWWTVKNSASQTVSTSNQQLSVAQGTSATSMMCFPALKPGTYSVSVFTVNAIGAPDSNTVTTSLTGGLYTLTIDPPVNNNPASGASPTCGTITPAPGTYPETPGASISVSWSPIASQTGCTFVQWGLLIGGGNQLQPSGQTAITLTMNSNVEAYVSFASQAASIKLITNVACADSSGCGIGLVGGPPTVNPTSATVYPVGSTAGPNSATFTIAPGTQSAIKGWNVATTQGSSMPYGSTLQGNATTVTLTYEQIAAAAAPQPAQSPLYFNVFAIGKLSVNLLVPTGSTGTTTNPAPGTYYVAAGSTFTVSYTVPSGTCAASWSVNGASQTPTNPLVLTINSITSLQLLTLPAGSPGCGSGGGGGGIGGLGTIANNIVGALIMASGGFVMVYPRTRKGEGGAG